MKIIAVIPARYESVRFPGKVLAKETGKYLVQHTCEQLGKSRLVEKILIATDSDKVVRACAEFGAEAVMTGQGHQSGTDRIAEAVADIDAEIVINVQADEPQIAPENIDTLAQLMLDNDVEMATLICKFTNPEDIKNPNIVKAVIDSGRCAMYFSRSAVPYSRDSQGIGRAADYYRHIGTYAYRKDFLRVITKLPQSRLEKIEKLEQLRVLENGFKILTGLVSETSEGIDTPQQYAEFVKRYNKSTTNKHEK